MATDRESKVGVASRVDESPRGKDPSDSGPGDESSTPVPNFTLSRWTWLRGSTPNYGKELEQWEGWARSEMMGALGKGMRMGDTVSVEYDIDRDEGQGKITVKLIVSGLNADAIQKRL